MKKLRIQKVIIDNFKGQTHIEVTLNELLNIIAGANGTGKTTILDAIWWLFFGKDSSGSEKFAIRMLDESGQPIHNTEIVVFAIIEIVNDGMSEIVTLKRSQTERWVTKRGTITAELQGNDTQYEVNGFPRKASEYAEYINSIMDERLFKMQSNPVYFPNMPWKEQRELLMQMATDITDVELATGHKEFECILDDMSKGTIDDLSSKYRNEMSELKKQQKEIPIRIDEVSKRKETVPSEKQLLKEKGELEKQIAEIDDFLAKEDVTGKIQSISEQIVELKMKQSDIVRKSRENSESEKHHLKLLISEDENKIKILEDRNAEQNRAVTKCEEYIINNEQLLLSLEENHKKNAEMTFNGSTVCPYCGQELPMEMLAEAKSHFDADKAKSMAEIDAKIASAKAEIERLKGNLAIAKKNQEELDAKISGLKGNLKTNAEALNAIAEPETPVAAVNLDKQISELSEKLVELQKMDVSGYQIAKDSFKERIAEIDKELLIVKQNAEIDERIELLRQELFSIEANATIVEQKAFAVEEFIKFKMETISKDIDSKFDGVHWKLFNRLINGGIEQCCECTFNGVGYKNLNSGHQIVVGLRIIDALSKHFGFATTVFIDNAESINDFYLPKMDTQMVLFKVTDDKELVIK